MKKKDVQHEVLIGRLSSIERRLDRIEEQNQPQIEVRSWWVGDFTGEKAQITKIESDRISYTYEDGTCEEANFVEFTTCFTPCEAPKKETWYLCTKDFGAKNFMRGKEYKMVTKSPFKLIDEEGFPHTLLESAKHFVSPQER